ncbi:efflux RND transporter permease subunit [Sulfurimonas sp.]
MFDFFYKRHYTIYSIIGIFFMLGVFGLFTLPKNLFPDANPPEIVVITSIPGATAQVAANSVSKPIEQEVSRLAMVTDVSSVNVANYSIVKVDFSYEKNLNAAAVDVSNALSIAKVKLPANANPSVYTTGDFTMPVDVIALSPKNKNISLADIRKIAESFIKPHLLSNKSIGNVEVFGGYQSSINIEVDPFKAKRYGVNFETLAKAIETLNHDMPVGFLKGKNDFYTITFYGEKDNILKLKQLEVMPNVRLSDIADVSWAYKKRTSGYIGNGEDAIALSIQRSPHGSVLDVSNAARSEMKKLQQKYPNIKFEISDTQRNLVEQSNTNMLEALRDAIFYTLIVIMLFLGNLRAIIAAGISIPMVFFASIAIIWLSGGELNIVVYTAIILSLGMLTDDAVVVLENIERHLNEGKEDLQTAIRNGTKEVVKPVFAGTLATITILFPLMFIGGFPEKIFRPLIETLIVALIVSYFLSITFIPILSQWLYKNGTQRTKFELFIAKLYPKTIGKFISPFVAILHFTNGEKLRIFRRMILIGGGVFIMVISLKNIIPTIGRDAMPPMDTGIIKAQVMFSSNDTVESAEKRIEPVLKWLEKQPWFVMSSVAFGTEPGVLSLGSGNLPAEATITINAVNRFERTKTIWELEDLIRDKISKLKGIKRNDVYDFGATPVSSIKAPLVLRLQSPTLDGLATYSHKVENAMKKIPGLTSLSTSWDKDFMEVQLDIDENKALSYGITPYQIIMQLPLKGQSVSLNSDLASMNVQVVRLYLKGKFAKNIQTLKLLPISTKFGEIPLSEFATITKHLTYSKIERDNMEYSLDVNGYRAKRAITHITDAANKIIQDDKLDKVKIVQAGTIVSIKDSFTRMIKALGLGLVLLILTLMAIYRSFKLAIIMVLVMPLAMTGAAWSMLFFDKPMCLPSMLGVLLLFSIVVKNAVLFVDFYQEYKEDGDSPFESALEAMRVRYRPIMMTTFGTIAGMLPIALEDAIGLERLSPLADVSIGGLLTFTVLIYVPMFTYIFDKNPKKIEE